MTPNGAVWVAVALVAAACWMVQEGVAQSAPTTTTATTITTVSTTAVKYHIMDCTADSPSLASCNPGNFIYRVAIWGVPGIFMGLWLLVCCPLYCGGKYCCNCCGGRNQTPNFCCPARRFPARYSKSDLIRPRVLLVLAFAAMGFAAGWGFMYGTTPLIVGTNGLLDGIKSVPDALKYKAGNISSSFLVTRISKTSDDITQVNLYETSSASNTTESARAAMQSAISSAMAQVDQYLVYVPYILDGLIFAPAAIGLLTLVCALASLRKFLPMTAMWIAFLLAIVGWLSQGLFSVASVGVDYVCNEVVGLADMKKTVLPAVISCSEGTFAEALDKYKNIEASEVKNSCSALRGLCYNSSLGASENAYLGQAYDCTAYTTPCNSSSLTFLVVLNQFNYMKVHSSIYGDATLKSQGYACNDDSVAASACTMTACEKYCKNSTGLSSLGLTVRSAAYDFRAAKNITTSVALLGLQYGSCASVLEFITASIVAPCLVLSPALTVTRQMLAVHGGGLILLLYCAGWGAKRFLPLKEANEPIEPDIPFDDPDADLPPEDDNGDTRPLE